jgi:hypothetical protein
MRATVLLTATLGFTALATCPGAAGENLGTPVADSCPQAQELRYFPVGALYPGWNAAGLPDADLLFRRLYSKYLAEMEEPSLSCGVLEETEAYRFLWLRSFDNPIAVRVFRRGDNYRLDAVILHVAHPRELGNVPRRITKKLSLDQWRALTAKLEEVQLWQMATRSKAFTGTDGAQWIVEARRDGRYHVVDRWDGTDGLKSVGMHFLDLAGLGDVGPVY